MLAVQRLLPHPSPTPLAVQRLLHPRNPAHPGVPTDMLPLMRTFISSTTRGNVQPMAVSDMFMLCISTPTCDVPAQTYNRQWTQNVDTQHIITSDRFMPSGGVTVWTAAVLIW